MASYNAYPPHRLHSSHPIPPSEALDLLSKYIESAATDPSLHPNALLTENGPTSQGTSAGLVLHNLKRVEAGLRGEHLGADLSFAEFGGDGQTDLKAQFNGDTLGPKASRATETLEVDGGDWQDKEDFDREQDIEEGDIGERSQAARTEDTEVPRVNITMSSANKDTKEARKLRKKERRRKERREKETRKKFDDETEEH